MVSCHTVFKDEQDNSKINATLKAINNYHGLSIIADLLRATASFTKSKFEFDLDVKLKELYPRFIEVERTMIPVKVAWFSKRVKEWPLVIAEGKTEITFDNFSDFTFGAMEMFSSETTPKAFEKIFKAINLSEIEGKSQALEEYVTACSKILTDETLSQEITFENAFKYSKVIQTFAYMLSNFNGITILITMKERGVINFCMKAIIFGLNFIKHHKEGLLKIKSIKEHKKPDKQSRTIP